MHQRLGPCLLQALPTPVIEAAWPGQAQMHRTIISQRCYSWTQGCFPVFKGKAQACLCRLSHSTCPGCILNQGMAPEQAPACRTMLREAMQALIPKS